MLAAKRAPLLRDIALDPEAEAEEARLYAEATARKEAAKSAADAVLAEMDVKIEEASLAPLPGETEEQVDYLRQRSLSGESADSRFLDSRQPTADSEALSLGGTPSPKALSWQNENAERVEAINGLWQSAVVLRVQRLWRQKIKRRQAASRPEFKRQVSFELQPQEVSPSDSPSNAKTPPVAARVAEERVDAAQAPAAEKMSSSRKVGLEVGLQGEMPRTLEKEMSGESEAGASVAVLAEAREPTLDQLQQQLSLFYAKYDPTKMQHARALLQSYGLAQLSQQLMQEYDAVPVGWPLNEATAEFTITLRKTPEKPHLGLSVGLSVDEEHLVVNHVDGGMVGAWNAANPAKQVRPGDKVMSVNSSSGDAHHMTQLCKKDDELVMVILRGEKANIQDRLPPTSEDEKQNLGESSTRATVAELAEASVRANVLEPSEEREESREDGAQTSMASVRGQMLDSSVEREESSESGAQAAVGAVAQAGVSSVRGQMLDSSEEREESSESSAQAAIAAFAQARERSAQSADDAGSFTPGAAAAAEEEEYDMNFADAEELDDLCEAESEEQRVDGAESDELDEKEDDIAEYEESDFAKDDDSEDRQVAKAEGAKEEDEVASKEDDFEEESGEEDGAYGSEDKSLKASVAKEESKMSSDEPFESDSEEPDGDAASEPPVLSAAADVPQGEAESDISSLEEYSEADEQAPSTPEEEANSQDDERPNYRGRLT